MSMHFTSFTKHYLNFVQLIYLRFILILVKILCIVTSIEDNIRINKIKVLFQILEKLTTWYAPVLCHTMEEVWQNLKQKI